MYIRVNKMNSVFILQKKRDFKFHFIEKHGNFCWSALERLRTRFSQFCCVNAFQSRFFLHVLHLNASQHPETGNELLWLASAASGWHRTTGFRRRKIQNRVFFVFSGLVLIKVSVLARSFLLAVLVWPRASNFDRLALYLRTKILGPRIIGFCDPELLLFLSRKRHLEENRSRNLYIN